MWSVFGILDRHCALVHPAVSSSFHWLLNREPLCDNLHPVYLVTSWWTFGLCLHFGSCNSLACLCVDMRFYFIEDSRRMAVSHGELMFSFLGKCQLFPKWLYYLTSLAVCSFPHPHWQPVVCLFPVVEDSSLLFVWRHSVLLCSPGCPVTGSLPASVSRWGVPHTYSP